MAQVGGRHLIIRIEKTDPATAPEDDLVRCHGFLRQQHDEMDADEPFPPLESWLAQARVTHPWYRARWLLAWDTDRTAVVARGVLSVSEAEPSDHTASIGIDVLPQHRREGLGTGLLRRLVAAAGAEHRTLLTCTADERSPAVVVLPRWGFAVKQLGRLSRLLTAELDRALLDSWVAEPGREGYELVRLDGPVPDDLLAGWLRLEQLMNDAPRDDLERDDLVVTPERFRAREADALRLGYRGWRLAARHRASGALVGCTVLAFPPERPEQAGQGLTAVVPEHRGHGLGRWLKAANALRLLDERPEVTHVDTWNASSNSHMVAINQAMGFDVIRRTSTWQASTAAVIAALAPADPSRGRGRGRA